MKLSVFLNATGAVLVLVVLGLCGAILGSHYVPAYQGTDENGYIMTAKRLAVDGDSAKYQDDPLEFVSGNWVEARENVYYAKYPLGYPWLCAAAYRWGGPSAVFLVNPILAILAVAGMYLLGRAMLGDFAGILAALLLATNPLHLMFGITALTHTGAICFAVWGMWLAWRWSEKGGWTNAALAGALTGYAIAVRYSEGLLALPVAALVIWRLAEIWRSHPVGQRRTPLRRVAGQAAVMLAAGILTLAPLLYHHWVAFGAPWITGYSLCQEATGFGWKWFVKNWELTLGRLNSAGLFLLFPLGLAGLVFAVVHRGKLALFLWLWALPSLLLHTAYYWAPQGEGWGYVRFFVSIFPPLILGALALLLFAVRPRPVWNVAVGLLLLLVVVANVPEAMRQLAKQEENPLFAHNLSDMVHEKIGSGAVLMSQEHILNFLEYAGDFRLYAQDAFDRGAIKSRIKVLDDDEPHPFHRRKARQLARRVGNQSDAQLNEVLGNLVARHLARGRRAAVVTAAGNFPQWRGRLGGRFVMRKVAECAESRTQPDGGTRSTLWAIYSIGERRPADVAAGGAAEIESKIDQFRFNVGAMRRYYQERFPGAQEQWTRIMDTEKQIRDLQDQLKQLRARNQAPAVKPAGFVAARPGGTNSTSAARWPTGGRQEAR